MTPVSMIEREGGGNQPQMRILTPDEGRQFYRATEITASIRRGDFDDLFYPIPGEHSLYAAPLVDRTLLGHLGAVVSSPLQGTTTDSIYPSGCLIRTIHEQVWSDPLVVGIRGFPRGVMTNTWFVTGYPEDVPIRFPHIPQMDPLSVSGSFRVIAPPNSHTSDLRLVAYGGEATDLFASSKTRIIPAEEAKKRLVMHDYLSSARMFAPHSDHVSPIAFDGQIMSRHHVFPLIGIPHRRVGCDPEISELVLPIQGENGYKALRLWVKGQSTADMASARHWVYGGEIPIHGVIRGVVLGSGMMIVMNDLNDKARP